MRYQLPVLILFDSERSLHDQNECRLFLVQVVLASGISFRLLEEGVAASARDVDVATVLGIGFPDFHGGVVGYARGLGPDEVRRRLDELTDRHGPRYAVCGLLRHWKGDA